MTLERLTTNSDTFRSWKDKINAMIEAVDELKLASEEDFKNGVQGTIPLSSQVLAYLEQFKRDILEEIGDVDGNDSIILQKIDKTVEKEIETQNVDAITMALIFGG